MASGLSDTLIASDIVRLDAFRCRVVDRPNPPIAGQILSARSHNSSSGLRYFEVEWERINATAGRRTCVIFMRGATTGLEDLPGVTSIQSMVDGIGDVGKIDVYQSGSPIASFGSQRGIVTIGNGKLYRVWVDCASRKVWITNEANPSQGTSFRPDTGDGQHWIFPEESGVYRLGLSPGYGGAGVPHVNDLRLRSRYQDLLCEPLYGAIPWDARQVTISGTLNSAQVDVGDTLRWAWFDHASPHEIASAPTSTGTLTVGAGHAYSVSPWTSLDPGGEGSLLLMDPDSTPTSARSHYRPVIVP